MSAIGKIFIVLNLVLSLVIVGAAASYLSKADDWKKKHDELQADTSKEIEGLKQEISNLEASRRNLQTEVDDKRSRIDDLEVSTDSLQQKLTSQEVENEQLRGSVEEINATLKDFRQNMNDLNNRNSELADQNTQLRNERLDAVEKQQQAEQELARVQGDLNRSVQRVQGLEDSLSSMEQDKGHLESLLEVAKSRGFDVSSLVAMKKIDAVVVDVDNDLGLVILSVGKEDEVAKGWTFQVYRDDMYLGEVQVDEVYDKYSAARVKFRVAGADFRVHDNASTVL